MQQTQQRVQHVQQGVAGASGSGGIVTAQRRFGQFHEPVAHLVPGELVQALRQQVEAVIGEVLGRFRAGALELGEDPLFGVGLRLRRAFEAGVADVHQCEAGRVPQLVAEILVALGARQIELDIAAGAGQCGHGEAQRVGAVGIDAVRVILAGLFFDLFRHFRLHQAVGAFGNQIIDADAVDDVQRIEHVALRLRHFLAVLVAHQTSHVHVVERHHAGEVVGHHHHPRHPEEDDVKARHQYAGRDGVRKAALGHRGLLRPTLRGKREHGRGEPGFQHVGILP